PAITAGRLSIMALKSARLVVTGIARGDDVHARLQVRSDASRASPPRHLVAVQGRPRDPSGPGPSSVPRSDLAADPRARLTRHPARWSTGRPPRPEVSDVRPRGGPRTVRPRRRAAHARPARPPRPRRRGDP